jgi:hypothetical protein
MPARSPRTTAIDGVVRAPAGTSQWPRGRCDLSSTCPDVVRASGGDRAERPVPRPAPAVIQLVQRFATTVDDGNRLEIDRRLELCSACVESSPKLDDPEAAKIAERDDPVEQTRSRSADRTDSARHARPGGSRHRHCRDPHDSRARTVRGRRCRPIFFAEAPSCSGPEVPDLAQIALNSETRRGRPVRPFQLRPCSFTSQASAASALAAPWLAHCVPQESRRLPGPVCRVGGSGRAAAGAMRRRAAGAGRSKGESAPWRQSRVRPSRPLLPRPGHPARLLASLPAFLSKDRAAHPIEVGGVSFQTVSQQPGFYKDAVWTRCVRRATLFSAVFRMIRPRIPLDPPC